MVDYSFSPDIRPLGPFRPLVFYFEDHGRITKQVDRSRCNGERLFVEVAWRAVAGVDDKGPIGVSLRRRQFHSNLFVAGIESDVEVSLFMR